MEKGSLGGHGRAAHHILLSSLLSVKEELKMTDNEQPTFVTCCELMYQNFSAGARQSTLKCCLVALEEETFAS